jgi:hypothetical protein
MISDVLSDAIDSVEQYQVDCGDTYEDIAGAVEKVKLVMDGLRVALDLPPVGAAEEKARRLLKLIIAIDTNELRKVIDEPLATA